MRDQCGQKENRMEEYDKTLDSNSRREEQEIEEKENQKLEDYGSGKSTCCRLSVKWRGMKIFLGIPRQPSMIMCFLNWLSWRMMIR